MIGFRLKNKIHPQKIHSLTALTLAICNVIIETIEGKLTFYFLIKTSMCFASMDEG